MLAPDPSAVTALVISLLIGNNLILKLSTNDIVQFLGLPEVYYVADDSQFGLLGSPLDLSLNSVYTNVRYTIFSNAEHRFIQYVATQNPGTTQLAAFKQIKVQSSKSLCGALIVPVFLNKAFPTKLSSHIAIYKRMIEEQLVRAKSQLTFFGQAYLDELDNHIHRIMIMIDVIVTSPEATVNAAYALPIWTQQGSVAANACVSTINRFKM